MKKIILFLMLPLILFSCQKEEIIIEEIDNFSDGFIEYHGYVDLGLSVKWATCNVGATTPYDFGNYYAWGEVIPKSSYSSGNSFTYGKVMGDISGSSTYDAARANWGGSWRMPTKAEFEELKNNCVWYCTIINGVYGCKVTSIKNGKSIFLPAAKYCGETMYDITPGDRGFYWSSTPKDDYSAYDLFFNHLNFDTNVNYRHSGHSVRAVSD